MQKLMDDVTAFHEAMDHPVGRYPESLPEDRLELRIRLITEETAEMCCALLGLSREVYPYVQRAWLSILSAATAAGRGKQDVVEAADGAMDAMYVIVGTLVELGIPAAEVWDEVQRANMAKTGGPKDPFGKTLKPEGWTPPDVEGIIHAAITRGRTQEAAANDTYGRPAGA
jgi:predicted HAD superfamily Cof-like phosphohydrolase